MALLFVFSGAKRREQIGINILNLFYIDFLSDCNERNGRVEKHIECKMTTPVNVDNCVRGWVFPDSPSLYLLPKGFPDGNDVRKATERNRKKKKEEEERKEKMEQFLGAVEDGLSGAMDAGEYVTEFKLDREGFSWLRNEDFARLFSDLTKKNFHILSTSPFFSGMRFGPIVFTVSSCPIQELPEKDRNAGYFVTM